MHGQHARGVIYASALYGRPAKELDSRTGRVKTCSLFTV